MMKLHHALLAAGLMMPAAAEAHFQLIHVETPLIEAPGDVPVKLIFWHPFENGHVMDMGPPQAFYAVSRGEKIDLAASLTPFTFTGASNAAQGFDAVVPVTKAGDYVLVVEPAPYLEPSEDIFIQQFAKVYLNRMELPTDWTEPQGLPTEILPLVKPYNVIAGSTFTGRVLSEGQPVAGAEIEVEFMAAEPDMATNAPRTPVAGPMPGGAVVAVSDADGTFTFGIPKAGWWGFAALGTGPVKEHEGRELSQDAVIWVRAWDME
ncbi:DUF4198 domain-containing protein (plasmid) [Cereibacter azotoformans]|nr:DUF4198 domain-containing protein [Cereibacter azotoformans]ULB12380.1 DUF4198 domain-containing protein [Cereibacter azotoformans]